MTAGATRAPHARHADADRGRALEVEHGELAAGRRRRGRGRAARPGSPLRRMEERLQLPPGHPCQCQHASCHFSGRNIACELDLERGRGATGCARRLRVHRALLSTARISHDRVASCRARRISAVGHVRALTHSPLCAP